MAASKTPRTRRTQVERSEATRTELLEAARILFGRDGYEAAALDELAARGGVTKGALYHHFGGKRELFAAVYEEEQRRLSQLGMSAYAKKTDPREGFHAACKAFLEACLDPEVQRIALLDGPAVLGWERVREIGDRHSLAMLRQGLERAMQEGTIARRPVEPLVQLLNGALCESAMFVARSDRPRPLLRNVLGELRTMVDALTAPPRSAKNAT